MEKAFSLRKIAEYVGGKLVGDSSPLISGIAPLEEAGDGELSFADRRYRCLIRTTRATALILPPDLRDEFPGPRILSPDPYLAFQRAMVLFYGPYTELPRGVHRTAVIGDGVVLGAQVSIGPYAVVEERCEIGDRVYIGAGCYIGPRCKIGPKSRIYPHVVLYPDVEVGRGVIIHSGTVIGPDGFGFAFDGTQYHKVPQVGKVVIEDEVEIGAQVAVDRATLGCTVIGKGTKIDNLVQVAHNVVIGPHTVIAGQAGISGSTRIGAYVQVGGQAGFRDHIKVGDRARVAAQAGVTKSIPSEAQVSGYPA
ncbi:MAG TPA: UDP-3-O-(3-hydroxymyristoyl)glucosamine N-acyltransferase [Candidatus Latescibacteria bacterium]|nr:UDP-3-O-(3-hydroxymyristoyl)glucosamine N-acyltransferase [Candidatus Latescibacterota bacterium]